jgi:hypothetical protein
VYFDPYLEGITYRAFVNDGSASTVECGGELLIAWEETGGHHEAFDPQRVFLLR